MSVSNTTFRLGFENLVSPPESGLPYAVWFAHGEITGDASGGTATIIIDLPERLIWAIEGVAITGGVAENALFRWFPQVTIGEGATPAWDMCIPLVQFGSSFKGLPSELFAVRGLPVSRAHTVSGPVSGVNTTRFLVTLTNTNLVGHELEGWGYVWDRRVLTLPGGLQRP